MNNTGRPKGSKTNTTGLSRLKALTSEELVTLYASGLASKEIGEIYGVSRTAVDNRLKHHGIARRWHDETATLKNAKMTVALTDEQEQLLLGSVLGDACLHRYFYNTKRFGQRRGCKVQFAQGAAQLPYLRHKRDVMLVGREKLPKSCVSKLDQRPEGHNLGDLIYQFAFSHTPTLDAFSERFNMHRDGKVFVSREWLAALSPLGVAYWFADDGTILTGQANSTWRFTLNTDAYCAEELEMLLGFVRQLGAPSARLHKKREGQFAVETYRREEVEALAAVIAPCVPECMRHKLKDLK